MDLHHFDSIGVKHAWEGKWPDKTSSKSTTEWEEFLVSAAASIKFYESITRFVLGERMGKESVPGG